MLTNTQVVQIIDELKKSAFCYVSEAHIQLQFAIIGAHKFGNQFDFFLNFLDTRHIAQMRSRKPSLIC